MELILQIEPTSVNKQLIVTEKSSDSTYLNPLITMSPDLPNEIKYNESTCIDIFTRSKVDSETILGYTIKDRSKSITDNNIYRDIPELLYTPEISEPEIEDPVEEVYEVSISNGIITVPDNSIVGTILQLTGEVVDNIIQIAQSVPGSSNPNPDQPTINTGILTVWFRDNTSLLESYQIETVIGQVYKIYPKRIDGYICQEGTPVTIEITNPDVQVAFLYEPAEFVITDNISTFDIEEDGYHICYHIVLPNKQWILNNPQMLGSYNTIIFEDNSKIYQYYQGQIKLLDFDILTKLNITNTTISRTKINVFAQDSLKECYINHSLNVLKSRLNKCDYDKILDYNRDMTWIIYNIIQYYIEKEMYAQAEQLFEELNGCRGLCKNVEQTNGRGYGCGCTQRYGN